MERINDMINLLVIRMMQAINGFCDEERGDTNFLSIAIILVVVLALAVVFIGFGDTLTAGLEDSINELKDALGI